MGLNSVGEQDPVRRARLLSVRDGMHRHGIDVLLITPSADLFYLTGNRAHDSERPTILVIPHHGDAAMLLPRLEKAGANLDGIRPVTYDEIDDPYSVLVESAVGRNRAGVIAISDRARASVLLNLQRAMPAASFISSSGVMREFRMIKSPAEIELLQAAGKRADLAFGRIVREQFAGRSELELANSLRAMLNGEQLETADWGPIVGSGPNSASPHHSAGTRIIGQGDAIVLDFGGSLQGYQADITRTVYVGSEPPDGFKRAYATVRKAQEAGVNAVRPGVSAQSVDRVTRGVIEEAGYGEYFTHRTGHGLGLDTHEEPYIVEGNELLLEPGMVFSVEPGVYIPGKFGIRIEDAVAVTDDGGLALNCADHNLITVA